MLQAKFLALVTKLAATVHALTHQVKVLSVAVALVMKFQGLKMR